MKRIRMEVSPHQGRWKITKCGPGFWMRDTQAEAIKAARQVIHNLVEKGGFVSLKIKRRDGTIREERTYPRSSDPKRSKG